MNSLAHFLVGPKQPDAMQLGGGAALATNRFALALGFVAASTALAGCPQDDYYCDDNGCYSCDGLGCRDVTAPGRTACTCGDRECGSGTACTALGCTLTCTDAGQCPRGTQCEDGFCVNPRETAPTTVNECPPCTADAECAAYDPGYVCVDGECLPPARPNCTTSADCSAPAVCVAGECRTPDDVCHFNSECGQGRICVNQHCTTGCTSDTMCPSGATCQSGYCVESPTQTCTMSSQCGAGRVCVSGTCWDGCDSAEDCGTGRYCGPDGRCRVDDRPQPSCTSNVQCLNGGTCVDGVCRSPCNSVTDCRRFDEQLTYCQDHLCYTTMEGSSDCTAQSDCTSGQSCVGGNCR